MEQGFGGISVIIPTFRRPLLLAEAVASVLAQEGVEFELVIVDDDPQMSARDIAAAFDDRRIVYVPAAGGQGAAAARNAGIRVARGGWVSFLDDDDFLYKDFLGKMAHAASQLPQRTAVLQCGVAYIDACGRKRLGRPRHRGDVHRLMLCGEKSGGINGLVRRDALVACGGFDEKLPSAQDWDLWIRMSREYMFDYIDDVLVGVRDFGPRISADVSRAIRSREIILDKYADEFAQVPEARGIHRKRLGKLCALSGNWDGARLWFCRAAEGRPLEWFKILAWLLAVRPGWDKFRDIFYGAAVFFVSTAVAVYSQMPALRSVYMVNDDVCQHIWWMRMGISPELLQDDLLAQYARSLQNIGILGFYQIASLWADPLSVARYLPFILFPLAALALYRWVLAWTKEAYAAFLASTVFMVTPIYMQHLTGGQSHVFGYPLLLSFLCAFRLEQYRLACGVMVLAAMFFPIIFLLAGVYWIYAFCHRKAGGFIWKGPAAGERMLWWATGLGALVISARFMAGANPLIGDVLPLTVVKAMPELTSLGRWEVWPVAPVWQALVVLMEKGVFVFQAGHKVILAPAWKDFLLQGHALWMGLAVVVGGWWWRRRTELSFRPAGLLVLAGVFLYVLAGGVLLKLYAPDRYLMYAVTLAGLVAVVVPAGMTLAAWPRPFVRQAAKVVAVAVVLAWAPLVKGAGLKDFASQKELYSFLASLPQDVRVASFPDTADAIPVFSRRRVFISAEMSVPLFDRYWDVIRGRTLDFMAAYYAQDPGVLFSFCRRNNVTHVVVEQRHFMPDFLEGKVYFEPFGTWVKALVRGRDGFYLQQLSGKDCVWEGGGVCVVDARLFSEGGRS